MKAWPTPECDEIAAELSAIEQTNHDGAALLQGTVEVAIVVDLRIVDSDTERSVGPNDSDGVRGMMLRVMIVRGVFAEHGTAVRHRLVDRQHGSREYGAGDGCARADGDRGRRVTIRPVRDGRKVRHRDAIRR